MNPQDSPPQSCFLTVNEHLHLHYLDWGGPGEPLIFLAGLSNTAYIYLEFAPFFTDGWRVLDLTRRGHGRSSQCEPYDLPTLVDDLRTFMDRLGIARAHLVGHSIAGAELTAFATTFPERTISLTYLDAAYDRRSQLTWAFPLPQVAEPSKTDTVSVAAYLAYIRREEPYFGRAIWSPAVEADYQARLGEGSDGRIAPLTPDSVYAALVSAVAAILPDYTKIRAPILSYYTEMPFADLLPADAPSDVRSRVEGWCSTIFLPWQRAAAAQLQREAPHAQIHVLPNTWHHPFIQQRLETARQVREFLLSYQEKNNESV